MNALPTLRHAIARMDSFKLADLRRRIEQKLFDEATAGPVPQSRARSFVREVDVITAAAEELHSRDWFAPSPGPSAVDRETVLGNPDTLVRLPFFVKVF